jgi:hypothetical protein
MCADASRARFKLSPTVVIAEGLVTCKMAAIATVHDFLPSVIDLARLSGGSRVADRLQQEMKASIDWKKRQEKIQQKHPFLVIDSSMNQNIMNQSQHKFYVSAVKSVLLTHDRSSNIVNFLPKPPVEARPSPIHGTGVFAVRDIPAFSYLTIYPCDGVLWQSSDWTHDEGMRRKMITCGHRADTHQKSLSFRQLLPEPPGTGNLIIEGNPALVNDPHFLAHMINDGAQCKRPEAVALYEAVSAHKMNSAFCPILGAHFSLRDIKAGDEILTFYGPEYWLDLMKHVPIELMSMD